MDTRRGSPRIVCGCFCGIEDRSLERGCSGGGDD
jgi:hypothetical protein